ncbi:hypothetical protein [Saccharopolyspora shandongensis]|uniref:hypothetical protein n=1 Tax=Saccharopolyspora shandongensis TaxID=418495 RepID=UPI0033C4354A
MVMRTPSPIRRMRPVARPLITAVVTSAVALLINVATNQPGALWSWMGVAVLTVLVGILSWYEKHEQDRSKGSRTTTPPGNPAVAAEPVRPGENGAAVNVSHARPSAADAVLGARTVQPSPVRDRRPAVFNAVPLRLADVNATLDATRLWVQRVQNADGGLPTDGKGSRSCTWSTAGLVWAPHMPSPI